jgi:nucleotide-binding universal stress UspA family protein
LYKRVLLAYDGTRAGRKALREGALLALRFEAKLFLLCVAPETPGMRLGEATYAGAIAQAGETYASLFDEAMEGLRKLGFGPSGRMVSGEPAAEIAAYAKEVGADVVVVGHRRKNLLERWWSGETGAYLIDHIGCSLLIARNEISDDEFWSTIGEEPQS